MRGRWLLVAVAAILLGAGLGALSLLIHPRREPEAAPAASAAPAEEISLTGVVRAQRVVGMAAPIEGTLLHLLVAVGQEVHEGQLLAQIRNTAVEDELKAATEEVRRLEDRQKNLESSVLAARLEASRAKADFSRAQAEFFQAEKAALRQQVLYREGATPRRVYEAAQAEFKAKQQEYETLRQAAVAAEERVSAAVDELESVRKALEEAKHRMEDASSDLLATDVTSPVNGVITGMGAKAGDEVHPEVGDLFQIAVDLSRMEVVAEPEPAVLEKVRPGQAATVHVAEAPGEAFPGSVRQVTDKAVVVEFTSPAPVVMPGQSAYVRIKLT
jgi:multidrug resistance efflux pump